MKAVKDRGWAVPLKDRLDACTSPQREEGDVGGELSK